MIGGSHGFATRALELTLKTLFPPPPQDPLSYADQLVFMPYII